MSKTKNKPKGSKKPPPKKSSAKNTKDSILNQYVIVGGTIIPINKTDLTKNAGQAQEVKNSKEYYDIIIDNLPPNSSIPVKFYYIFDDNTEGERSPSYILTTSEDSPLQPTGFGLERALGGVTVSWNGTYSGGTFFDEFKAIRLYAGTSPTLSPGSYTYVGQLTADKTNNTLFIPVDTSISYPKGQYVRYGEYVYIHASSINQGGIESSISANVANNSLGADGLGVDQIKAGTISANSYIRAGVKNLTNGSGSRIEIASNQVSDGAYPVYAGISIYNSGGSRIFYTDEFGNLNITGAITANSGNIAKFSIGSDSLTHYNSTSQTTVGIYNASQSLLNYTGGIKISKTLQETSYLVSYGLVVFPTSRDGQFAYSGRYSHSSWYIHDEDEGVNSEFIGDLYDGTGTYASGKIDARLLLNNTAGIVVKKDGNSYTVQAYNSKITPVNLNNSALRNIYVSSTAGNPTPSDPNDGDIKIEW